MRTISAQSLISLHKTVTMVLLKTLPFLTTTAAAAAAVKLSQHTSVILVAQLVNMLA